MLQHTLVFIRYLSNVMNENTCKR